MQNENTKNKVLIGESRTNDGLCVTFGDGNEN